MRDTGRVMQFCNKHKNFAYDIIFNNVYKDKPGYLSVDTMIDSLVPETVGGVLPHDEVIHAAAQEGMIADIPPTNPFYAALAETVKYLETQEEPLREEWESLLPTGEGIFFAPDQSAALLKRIRRLQQLTRGNTPYP